MNIEKIRREGRRITYRLMRWGQDHVPPVLRAILGILFCIGGVFGFLPVLGFWMFPLGLAFIALDIPFLRKRMDVWVDSLEVQLAQDVEDAKQNDGN